MIKIDIEDSCSDKNNLMTKILDDPINSMIISEYEAELSEDKSVDRDQN